MVGADNQPDRNVANAVVRVLCDRLTAPDRAAAQERAESLRQDIAALAVTTHQATGDAERGVEARRPEAQSRQSSAAALAQPTEPHPQPAARWGQEAGRYLSDCQARPGPQSDCLDAQRRFLDVFAKAMDGDTQAQRDTAATLDPPGSGLWTTMASSAGAGSKAAPGGTWSSGSLGCSSARTSRGGGKLAAACGGSKAPRTTAPRRSSAPSWPPEAAFPADPARGRSRPQIPRSGRPARDPCGACPSTRRPSIAPASPRGSSRAAPMG